MKINFNLNYNEIEYASKDHRAKATKPLLN